MTRADAHPQITRLDANRLAVSGGPPTTLFANEDVPLDLSALEELRALLQVEAVARRWYELEPERFDAEPEVEQVVLTPDLHPGAGVPIGTVLQTRGFSIPRAVGNDINCGVRLLRTDRPADALRPHLDALAARLRHVYFAGGRDVPLTQAQREAMLTRGLPGLAEAPAPDAGIWVDLDWDQFDRDLLRIAGGGGFPTERVIGLDDYLAPPGLMRDSQIGSIGGGNHFVEFQAVRRVLHGATAHAWDLHPGQLVVMVHSGSVGIGHQCGDALAPILRRSYPSQLGRPPQGIYPLPHAAPEAETFRCALHAAGNFAYANRWVLGQLALQVLREHLGATSGALLTDAAHNFAWRLPGQRTLHRKGACPAAGIGAAHDPYHGEPVLLPGAMGAPSYILEGLGNPDALLSASHGAGRVLSRGRAMRAHPQEFERFLRDYRVVTPLDPDRPDLREDVRREWRQALRQEAPFAYKPITPIVETLRDAAIAHPVAELEPLLTLKA